MNQHYCKKSIEAAIRVALVNPDTDIRINGERSKEKLYVRYVKFLGLICFSKLVKEEAKYKESVFITQLDVEAAVKKQLSPNVWVKGMVDIFLEEYKEYKKAA